MDSGKTRRLIVFVLLAAVAIFIFATSRSCRKVEEAIDHTADAATGTQAVRVGHELRQQLRDIENQRPDPMAPIENESGH